MVIRIIAELLYADPNYFSRFDADGAYH
jgi:hypothetical protein